QKKNRMLHVLVIVSLGNKADARSGAALDLIEHARAGAVGENTAFASAQLKYLLQYRHALAHRPRAGKRSEIAMRLLQLAAMEAQLRKAFTGQTNVGIALVVAEQYVVARLVRLDEIVFEQQRFALGTSHGGFDARDLADHHGGARMMVGFLEVTRYAFLQVARLAHIQSLSCRVQHA